MSKRVLIIILLISVSINCVAVFTIASYWWQARRYKGDVMPLWMERGQGWHRSPLRRELNLTDAQMEALQKNQEEMRQKMLPYRQELFTKRKELMELLKEAEPNRERADSLFREVVALQMELEAHMFDNLWSVRSILTPQQREKLEALMHELFEARRPPEPPLHHMPPPYEHRP
jgi:Spy/CpxP family protein refolding chaperone